MEILYLSHCAPNPPDKGEKIRAFHEIRHLSSRHSVHLACFARNRQEAAAARDLSDRCSSVYVQEISPIPALARAGLRFALGASLTGSFYRSRGLRRYVESLARRVPLAATVAYSSVMAAFAPPGVPLLLDMVDVDSEKWLQYASLRRPGFPYALEGRRLRRLESQFAGRARCTLLATRREAELFRRIAPHSTADCIENGVDFDYFDPRLSACPHDLQNRRFLVFVGAMDYYPNAQAACWFASRVFPALRAKDPGLEFFIVGRNPARAVCKLAERAGITVTGPVADVRPYLAAALAAVAPLQIARGIQNKVLEALAMGKRVLASTAVCDAVGPPAPSGLTACGTAQDFIAAAARIRPDDAACRPAIRSDARRRFSWEANMKLLSEQLEAAAAP
jgi:sugar transferase (PEP-CTERM/EpsH1 system associated)